MKRPPLLIESNTMFKQKDLVDEIGRGVLTKTCKVCGCFILDLAIHLKWHNKNGF